MHGIFHVNLYIKTNYRLQINTKCRLFCPYVLLHQRHTVFTEDGTEVVTDSKKIRRQIVFRTYACDMSSSRRALYSCRYVYGVVVRTEKDRNIEIEDVDWIW
jgi:hypothetical protein